MRFSALFSLLAIISATPVNAQIALTKVDQAAAFRAAGYKLRNGRWHGCDDPGKIMRYEPGKVSFAGDLNGDGRLEAVIVEGSLYCYGNTATGYAVVSNQRDGEWLEITAGPGIPRFLDSKGASGWPDLEVGGPGFCYLVRRWNGRAYVPHRHQYRGKPCRR